MVINPDSFFHQNFQGLWLCKRVLLAVGGTHLHSLHPPSQLQDCLAGPLKVNARDMLTHSLWAPWLEGDLEIAFVGNGDISSHLSASNVPGSPTAQNICQHSGPQYLGIPLISALSPYAFCSFLYTHVLSCLTPSIAHCCY